MLDSYECPPNMPDKNLYVIPFIEEVGSQILYAVYTYNSLIGKQQSFN